MRFFNFFNFDLKFVIFMFYLVKKNLIHNLQLVDTSNRSWR